MAKRNPVIPRPTHLSRTVRYVTGVTFRSPARAERGRRSRPRPAFLHADEGDEGPLEGDVVHSERCVDGRRVDRETLCLFGKARREERHLVEDDRPSFSSRSSGSSAFAFARPVARTCFKKAKRSSIRSSSARNWARSISGASSPARSFPAASSNDANAAPGLVDHPPHEVLGLVRRDPPGDGARARAGDLAVPAGDAAVVLFFFCRRAPERQGSRSSSHTLWD